MAPNTVAVWPRMIRMSEHQILRPDSVNEPPKDDLREIDVSDWPSF